MKVYIIHQYEACEYGEYYGVYKVYTNKALVDKEACMLSKSDDYFDYIVETFEVTNE